jgi:NitT/TauT family transport system substrate-binding protein
MRALMDGAIEAAALTLDEAILLEQNGVDARIVLIMDYSAGADALVAHPSIDNLEDLRNKRIGVETTALGAYVMQRILDTATLKLKDVVIVPLELGQHEKAFTDNIIDAVVTFDPVRSRLISMGAKVLFDTRAIPGEIVDVLVVRNEVIDEHKTHLIDLLESWFHTLDYIKENRHHAASRMKARLKLNEKSVINALQNVKFPNQSENRELILGKEASLHKLAEQLSSVMQKRQLIKTTKLRTQLLDTELLRSLYP